MRIHYLVPVLFIFFTSSCSRPSFYQISDFDQVTKSHKNIAILPFEVNTYGQLPKDIDQEMLAAWEALESIQLQADLYDDILESAKEDKGHLRISIQDYSETNKILADNEISIRASWLISPEELARILNVDAVLLVRVEKEQNFSDGLSAGIEIGQVLLAIFTNEVNFDGAAQNKMVIGDYAKWRYQVVQWSAFAPVPMASSHG